jgi:hypothetical protein
VVVLAGTVATDPIQRKMPSGDEVTELRLSVPEIGKRLLPLPIAAWHATVGARTIAEIAKGDAVDISSGASIEVGQVLGASQRSWRAE